MIIGSGIDVVDIQRFERQLERTPRLRERLFVPSERGLPLQSLAARFAAKEAAAKALKAPPGMIWQHCWIEKTEWGAPILRTEGTVVRSEYTGFGSDGQRQAPLRRETVAFTAGGREFTGRPLAEDRFHEDRSGQTVTVVHDPDRPARFIAPLHGDRLSRSPLGRLLGLAFGLLLVAGLMLLLENLFSYLETVGP